MEAHKQQGIVKVEFSYSPLINFSMQQNRTGVIHQLFIENQGQDTLKDVRVVLTAQPAFGECTPVVIEAIPAGQTVRIDSLNLQLSATYFAQLTERFAGNFLLEVTASGESAFKQFYPIDMLAYDQWGGLNVYPELLASFITPNHSALASVIKRAAFILEQWTGSPSLDEYQSRNPDRVRKQMAAIYAAIAEQNIIYSTIAPSFEASGQRIRLADTVLAQKLATCLDMALLYASCLETVGIHPLLIIMNGHAFAGGWLVPETFPDNVNDDVSVLTKRTAEGVHDIALVETTAMNMGSNIDFDTAVKVANGKLTDISRFILALDVKRARFSGIRPIPQRVRKGQDWEIEEDNQGGSDMIQPAPQNINPYDLSNYNTEVVITKQLLWERRLLDLSLRNSLLNIRITKNTLQLIPPDLASLEDSLAVGDEFRILYKPSDWENPLFNFGLYQSVPESDPVIAFVKSELMQKRLHSYLTERELSKSLTHLYRSSHTSMEENGANTLYLALGLLKWYETSASERPRYAPILLLPVEIMRKSAAKGFIIRSREEEMMMNVTLLEMLRQNFGITIQGLEPLPTDESGVNVKLIYSIIRNSIKDQRKWDVEEQAILGIFSFNKFIMWNDIHNNSHKLAKNKIVASLINGKIEWEADNLSADAAVLDRQLSPAELVLPISADSSQLEAIYEAVNDQTFILHGPPGTGKSQTITNIIANALYKGKRVLFVAEKMAALSVVQNRLAALGLAPFCLEIHSNKTKKSSVIAQLKETSQIVRKTSPDNFAREAERLLALRSELGRYVDALHRVYPFGISLYDAIVRYQSLQEEPVFEIPVSLLEQLDREGFLQWEEAIEMLVRTSNACGHPYRHPLTGISISAYSSALKDEVGKMLSTFIGLLTGIQMRLGAFFRLLGETEISCTRNDFRTITGIIGKLQQIPELTSRLLTLPLFAETMDEYREMAFHGKRRDQLQAEIETSFHSEVLAVNARRLLAAWDQASVRWFLPRYFGQRKIKKELGLYALGSVDKERIKEILHLIIQYQEETGFISGHEAQISALFGTYGRNEDWTTIEQIITDALALHSLILTYSKDIGRTAGLKQNLATQLSEGIRSFREMHGQLLHELYQSAEELVSVEKKLEETLGVTPEIVYADSPDWIQMALARANVWKDNLDKMKDWYQWLLVTRKLDEAGIGFIADIYKEKNLPARQMPELFRKSFYQAAIRYILSKENTLELFNGKMFNDVIEKYKQLSSRFQELTRLELFTRLASRVPSFTQEAIQNSEVGILQKNLRNNARGISIRKLFDQVPTLLSRMCPCMLMSPISVAQYIDADADKFDLIIFDEASQMPTYEAVGAIARGKNVVIVGDPKQMPPTSFFSVNVTDEEMIEMEDLESILDDCLALSIPSKYLLWHYRSKHESLIAFSNSEYYDNKLLTFPSPDNIESKVRLVPVSGFYDKGKSRQNKAEAQAVVNEIARRLRDEKLRQRSIGVVTFSVVQQALIEDLLSDLFVLHPDLETLALDGKEPLFIKNLENVQGDERDIILFSVGYGPDSEGRISMNFGPLNRVGGERRLNVAVSRARYEMIIFSTLKSEMIDLNRSSSVGVAGLKRFLEYAEKGERHVVDCRTARLPDEAASIENIVADKLRSLGYDVHTDIGSSGYKIDIGIVDSLHPSTYRLGIICDGKNYHCGKTVRDREIVQNSVLRMLGWKICRIWTMDWWENPEGVIASIQEALRGGEDKGMENEIPSPVTIKRKKRISQSVSDPLPSMVIKQAPAVIPYVKPESIIHCLTYKATELKQFRYDSELFYTQESQPVILSQIKKIVETEAPVSRSLLCKKVLYEWGIGRMGPRSDTYFSTLFDSCSLYQREYDGLVFFWASEEQCRTYSSFRLQSGREAVDLPPEEIANGIRQILTDSVSLPVAGLIKAASQLFGFSRSGANIDAAMQRGIQEAVRRNYAKIENDKVVIA